MNACGNASMVAFCKLQASRFDHYLIVTYAVVGFLGAKLLEHLNQVMNLAEIGVKIQDHCTLHLQSQVYVFQPCS
jgi:hypothetical protein